ncbi:MAG: YlxM family DNA-binding protein [Defluviitaleaceae bacterium]|nr:YlxM family DNA-binding protein [Defluviitaleaceae bacterium]
MLEKVTQINELYDVYQGLLTKKQQEYMELYYHEDWSLSEIADEVGVSRNAVHDNIRRTEKLLVGYEEKLKIYEKDSKRRQFYDKIKACTDDVAVLELVAQLEVV